MRTQLIMLFLAIPITAIALVAQGQDKGNPKTKQVSISAPPIVPVLRLYGTRADIENANSMYVVAATTDGTTYPGDRYAKCVPKEFEGTQGHTYIYSVKEGPDQLEHTFDWYSQQVFLAGTKKGTSVVRFGPWNRGHRANSKDLALAFYFDGKLLKEYSTLDIASTEENVSRSVSHYNWRSTVHGYCWLTSKEAKTLTFGFAIETIDKRVLAFDPSTGALLKDWYPR